MPKLLTLAALIALWSGPVDLQAAPAETVRVAGIVAKWIRGDKEANYRRVEPLIRQAASNGAQIVCTTECFLDGYAIADKSIPLETYRALGESIPGGVYLKKLSALAAELKIHLIAGMTEADGESRYNTAVFIGPTGKLLGKYRKQKLGHETVRNTAGSDSPVFDTPFGRVGLLICADRTDENLVRRLRLHGAELLICPSGGMFGPKTNDPILQARSRENRTPIVFVHPAEFLVTGADGAVLSQQLLGDALLVSRDEIGGQKDSQSVVYFDLPRPAKRVFKVASVQMRSGRDLDDNVRKTIGYLEACAKKGAEVAVFPECALTSYTIDVIRSTTEQQIEEAIQAIARACGEHKIGTVLGTPTREDGKLLNSAIIINPQGKIIERYHKVQLAEDWPVGGDHLSIFYLNGVPCSVIVCHDERYPELVRLPVLAGARVIFYTSHESGLRYEEKIDPYRAQIQARAAENNVFIAQANAPANTDLTGSHGHSRLIAPDGNILQEASILKEDILIGSFDLSQATARNARQSVTRGPFGKWYEEGVKQVKIIPE